MTNHKEPWTKKEIGFLKDNCSSLTDEEIGEKLGRTAEAIRSCRYRHDIDKFNGRKYQRWTEHEDTMIREHWPESDLEIVKNCLPGRSYNSVKVRAQKLKVTRNPSFSNEAQFKPKRVFKYTDEGVVTIVNLGGNDYCVLNKSGQEIMYHRVLWEQKNGPIPDDHVLRCKSENRANPDPDNWELISISQHCYKNLTSAKGHPAKELTDGWIAGKLAGGDKELKQELLNENPEMIRVARANFKLKREIKHGSS